MTEFTKQGEIPQYFKDRLIITPYECNADFSDLIPGAAHRQNRATTIKTWRKSTTRDACIARRKDATQTVHLKVGTANVLTL